MENKNTVIAVILMVAVWSGYTFFFPQNPSLPPQTTTEVISSPKTSTPPTSASLPIMEKSPNISNDVAVVEHEIVVDTELYRAVFSNLGGQVKNFSLKNYTESVDPSSDPVKVVDIQKGGKGSLRLSGTDDLNIFPDQLFSTNNSTDRIVLVPNEKQQLEFSTKTSKNITVQKIFTFYGDKYEFDLEVRVLNASDIIKRGNLDLALVQPWTESMEGGQYEFVGPATFSGEKLHKDDVDKIQKEAKSFGKDTSWSGFQTKYFIGAIAPEKDSFEKVTVKKVGDDVENIFESPYVSLNPGEQAHFSYLVYFGPLETASLKAAGHNLSGAVDLGFFHIIGAPLFSVLIFFNSFVHNYGLAIILLTVIIKLLFWPLTQKSYSSMKAMQKLQPEMAKIREKFKNDRERMNREIMELYKTHRVNPVGGCLPMIIQIPVFFALYQVLLTAIELRHAPFFFWITDLSTKDPYYITPLVMGVTMFIQQKMTPTTVDPMQAKIFMLMPVVFTFLFLNFPAGLVLYWLVNNLLTITQQYFINKK